MPDSPVLVVSVIWLALVAWLIARAFGQRNALRRVGPAEPMSDAPPLVVIVPARDEAHNIGECLRSLLAQRYPPDRVRFIVVDDESSDGTADIVTSMAAADPRIALVRAPPLPPGWKGKVHAARIGGAQAGEAEWLCILDAEMRAGPALLASAVAAAKSGTLD
ncbi:MAG: glycosyltransferase, partial [Steroidobacteraceae bacterium]